MGRHKGFEVAEVVRAARGVFWRDGYLQASVPDLERATGLARSSLYHAFGSKRGLFDAAVESYLTEIVRPRLAPLQAAVVAPTALVSHLERLRDALQHGGSAGDGDDRTGDGVGCLLLTAATGALDEDEAARQTLQRYRDELTAAIGRGVAALEPRLTPRQRAELTRLCASLVVAALTLARSDAAAAVGVVDAALALVRTPPATRSRGASPRVSAAAAAGRRGPAANRSAPARSG